MSSISIVPDRHQRDYGGRSAEKKMTDFYPGMMGVRYLGGNTENGKVVRSLVPTWYSEFEYSHSSASKLPREQFWNRSDYLEYTQAGDVTQVNVRNKSGVEDKQSTEWERELKKVKASYLKKRKS
jgi:hypothetical protein